MNDLELKNYDAQLGTQMRKGFLVYCVLQLCSHNVVYTSDIIKKLHDASLVVVEGTIYPLLSRLQKDGLLMHEWKESAQGPPRKYYRTSDSGKKILVELQKTNQQLQAALINIEKE